MTERPHDIGKVRISIARSLRDIEQLALDLHAQALNDANARDFPGGTALHMLGPAASIAAWEAQYEATEDAERWDESGRDTWAKRPKLDPAMYQGDTEDQPLNVLESWTRMIREDRGQPTGLAATISRECDYLRKSIDWACHVDEYDEPAWPLCFEMANELRTLVRRMEDVLREGDRIDTDAAPCFVIDFAGVRCGGTLARVNLKPRTCIHTTAGAHALAMDPVAAKQHKDCDQGGRDDLYRCLSCEKVYTPAEYWLAVREHMEREAG
jgi:hypothetical protein